jgi:hypothetical protein
MLNMGMGSDSMFEGGVQQARGTMQEFEGRANQEMGRGRFNFGRWLSRYEGMSGNGLLGGVFAFALTALAVSILLFPSMREGIGRRTGLYRPEGPFDRYTRWFQDFGHRLGIGR